MQTAQRLCRRIVEVISAILHAVTRDGYVADYGDRTVDTSEGRR